MHIIRPFLINSTYFGLALGLLMTNGVLIKLILTSVKRTAVEYHPGPYRVDRWLEIVYCSTLFI